MIIGLVIVALLVFAGVKLYKMMLGLLNVVATGGEMELTDEDGAEPEAVWTRPPYIADDSAYDDVTAVREYDETETTPAP